MLLGEKDRGGVAGSVLGKGGGLGVRGLHVEPETAFAKDLQIEQSEQGYGCVTSQKLQGCPILRAQFHKAWDQQ